MTAIKEKLIKDIRVHFDWKTDAIFFWVNSLDYFRIYSEIFINLLKRKWFKCNGYDHIYIYASEKKNEDIYKRDCWFFKYWSIAFSEKEYKEWNENIKNKLALKFIYNWLIDLARRDSLNLGIINEVYLEIQKKWIDTELIFKEIDHSVYHLTITYCPKDSYLYTIFFKLKDKNNNKEIKKEVNKWDKDFMYTWLQWVRITKKAIKIKPSQAMNSPLTGKQADPFEININDFIYWNDFKNSYKEYESYTSRKKNKS